MQGARRAGHRRQILALGRRAGRGHAAVRRCSRGPRCILPSRSPAPVGEARAGVRHGVKHRTRCVRVDPASRQRNATFCCISQGKREGRPAAMEQWRAPQRESTCPAIQLAPPPAQPLIFLCLGGDQQVLHNQPAHTAGTSGWGRRRGWRRGGRQASGAHAYWKARTAAIVLNPLQAHPWNPHPIATCPRGAQGHKKTQRAAEVGAPVAHEDDGALAHPRRRQLLHQLVHRVAEGQRLALRGGGAAFEW